MIRPKTFVACVVVTIGCVFIQFLRGRFPSCLLANYWSWFLAPRSDCTSVRFRNLSRCPESYSEAYINCVLQWTANRERNHCWNINIEYPLDLRCVLCAAMVMAHYHSCWFTICA